MILRYIEDIDRLKDECMCKKYYNKKMYLNFNINRRLCQIMILYNKIYIIYDF